VLTLNQFDLSFLHQVDKIHLISLLIANVVLFETFYLSFKQQTHQKLVVDTLEKAESLQKLQFLVQLYLF